MNNYFFNKYHIHDPLPRIINSMMADRKVISDEIARSIRNLKKEELVQIMIILVDDGYNKELRESRDGIRFNTDNIAEETLNKIYNFINNIRNKSERATVSAPPS